MKASLILCRRGMMFLRSHVSCRCVSTLSPLTSAFNTRPKKKVSFKMKESKVGLFNIPELTEHTGFELLEQKVTAQVASLVKEACSPDRTRKMVVIFDELSDCICRVADMADFVRVTHPEGSYQMAAQQTCLKMSEIVEKLNTNVDIHRALKHAIENDDVVELTDVDKRVAELFMFDFEQSGIHLPEDKRRTFVEINDVLMKIGNNFSKETQEPTPVMDYGLPPDLQNCFRVEGNRSLLNTLHSEHFVEQVREAAYKIFLYPNSYKEELLNDLLEGRRILANLVGFPSFAHRVLRGTLAESSENVMKFLESVSANLREGAQKDYLIMRELKQEQKNKIDYKLRTKEKSYQVLHDEIMAWDPPFFTASARSKMFDSEKLSEYFSLGACMDGLNNLFHCLFDVTLENVKTDSGELWHYDLYKLAVVHRTEGTLGYIYCDFYERDGKPNQDCHFTIQGGRLKEDGEYQLPVVVLQLNFMFPAYKTPSLLTPANMENLFHEFGHAMHSMLGRTRYQHVTGTRCPIDFAEVPSVLMEYFASDPRVLRSFAKHYETGKPLDEQTLQNFCLSKRRFLYSDTQLQVFYAILDQVYHGPDFSGADHSSKSTTDILKEVQTQHYGLPYVEKTAWQLRFGHLVGYGGKYYSYLMSRAIASRIWRQCFRDDPFNRENGEKYKQELLVHGGERHPSELIEGLLGEKPTIDMMVDSLTMDLRTRAVFFVHEG